MVCLFVFFSIFLHGQNVKVYNGVHGYTLEVPKNFSRVSTVDIDVYMPLLYKNVQAAQKAKKILSEGILDILVNKADSTYIKILSESIKVEVNEMFKDIMKQEIPRQYLLMGRAECNIEELTFKKINSKTVLYVEVTYTENNIPYYSVVAFLNGRDNVFTTIHMSTKKINQKKYSSIFKKILQTLVIK